MVSPDTILLTCATLIVGILFMVVLAKITEITTQRILTITVIIVAVLTFSAMSVLNENILAGYAFNATFFLMLGLLLFVVYLGIMTFHAEKELRKEKTNSDPMPNQNKENQDRLSEIRENFTKISWFLTAILIIIAVFYAPAAIVLWENYSLGGHFSMLYGVSNAFLLIVLVAVTAHYAKSTAEISSATQKQVGQYKKQMYGTSVYTLCSEFDELLESRKKITRVGGLEVFYGTLQSDLSLNFEGLEHPNLHYLGFATGEINHAQKVSFFFDKVGLLANCDFVDDSVAYYFGQTMSRVFYILAPLIINERLDRKKQEKPWEYQMYFEDFYCRVNQEKLKNKTIDHTFGFSVNKKSIKTRILNQEGWKIVINEIGKLIDKSFKIDKRTDEKRQIMKKELLKILQEKIEKYCNLLVEKQDKAASSKKESEK